jgi:hypothetical protein
MRMGFSEQVLRSPWIPLRVLGCNRTILEAPGRIDDQIKALTSSSRPARPCGIWECLPMVVPANRGMQQDFAFHSFVVKIWLEETAEEGGQVIWRGHITHVPSGKRKYIRNLDGLTAFITPYLEEMGVEPGDESCLRGRS